MHFSHLLQLRAHLAHLSSILSDECAGVEAEEAGWLLDGQVLDAHQHILIDEHSWFERERSSVHFSLRGRFALATNVEYDGLSLVNFHARLVLHRL